MKYISFFLLFAVLGTSLCLTSCKKQEEEETEKRYTIGVYLTGRPFAFQDENGALMGIEPELIRRIGKDEGFGVDFKVMESPEAIFNGIASGELHGGLGKLVREETDDESPVMYSDPYMSSFQTVLVAPEADLRKLSDLENRRVGVQKGSRADEVVSVRGGVFVRRYDHGTEAVEDLLQGKLEAVVMDNHAADALLERYGEQLDELEDTLAMVNYAMVTKRGDYPLAWEFNGQLLRLRGIGFVSELRDKYTADFLGDL